ncbi:unnamed protein product [Blepharisma stoltei]|uniref:Uncharacterized protein n=1 Tax=Blepharisma stoltei TaxID=1481888 RepID=A0AAU9K3T5_9CILI|nr:unnamed protein product [Blepharisma stoltei]
MEDLSNRSREKSFEEGFDYISEGEIIIKLQEKVKSQAQRLRALEGYKTLCETRIAELFPSHPFPVKNEHLGVFNSQDSQELHAAKQKIIRLEQQLSKQASLTPRSGTPLSGTPKNAQKLDEMYSVLHHKYNELVKDKSLVEETLRAEMLASEEQRTYIEILKQALEVNVEELGLGGIEADTFVEFVQNKTNIENTRKNTAKLQSAVLDQEIQIKKLNEEIEARIQDCNEMAEAKEKMEKQLSEVVTALEFAEGEASRFEIERNSLIDYIEEHKKKGDLVAENLNEVEEKHAELNEQYQKIADEHENLHLTKKEIEAELENKKKEIEDYLKKLEELQEKYINSKAKIEEKDKQIIQLKDNLNKQTARNKELEESNSDLNKKLRENEQEMEDTLAELEEIKNHEAQLGTELSELNEDLNKAESELREGEEIIKDLRKELEDQLTQNTNLNSNLDSNSKQIEELNSEITKAWTTQKEAYQREQNLVKTNNELCSKLSETQQKTELLQAEIEELNYEITELKEKYEEASVDLINLREIRTKLEQELQKTELELSNEKCNSKYFQDEVVALKIRIEDLNLALKIANENYQDRDDKLRISGYKNDELNEEINRIKEEVKEEKREKQGVEEALRKALIDNERIIQEKTILEEQIAECCRSSGELIEKLKECEFSKDFNDFISSWSKIPSDVLSLQRLIQLSLINLFQLYQQNSKYSEDLLVISSKLQSSLSDCDNLAKEESSLRSREAFLRNQIEQIYQENSRIRESLNSQITSLHQEVIFLRSEIHKLHDENEYLNTELRSKSLEYSKAKQAEEYYKHTLEEKTRLYNKHKIDFEEIIREIWKAKSIESQRVFEQIMRVKTELEHAENDKSRILEQILKLTEDGDAQIRETLKKQVNSCDEQIETRKGLIKRLEDEIRGLESKSGSIKLNGDRSRSYIRIEGEIEPSEINPKSNGSTFRSQSSEEQVI